MTRGGKRNGAGRHKLPPGQKKLKTTITIRPDQWEWLKSRTRQPSTEIEKAVDYYKEKIEKGDVCDK